VGIRNRLRALVLLVAAALLAACTAGQHLTAPALPATSGPAVSVAPPSVAPSTTTPASSSAPRPRPSLVVAGRGIVLPDRAVTPGAVDPRVTQADIRATICVAGYSARVRPASSYTTALKIRQLAAGYAFHGDRRTADYEEDHLISIELGGSPSSPKNLWPEPYRAGEGARVKDRIEDKLHALVCAGRISLRTAQRAIATDWWRAYQRYIGVPIAPPRPRAAPVRRPPAAPVQHACTTTSSGNCIRGGEFCPRADYGMAGYDAAGRRYVCQGDAEHPHWEL
jgi:hypothetical protein